MSVKKLNSFEFEGQKLKIFYIESVPVAGADGVICNVFKFESDDSRDLAIIEIAPGGKTPLQKVLSGDKTIEGFISGKGTLLLTGTDGVPRKFEVDEHTDKPTLQEVKVGETMQWQADNDSNLLVYEICYPPYQDGRYQNL
jgi:hypothetical protein